MSARWPAEELDPEPTHYDVNPSEASSGPPPAPPGEIQPANIEHLETAMESQPAVRSLAATLLLVIALFYTLYFARAFFLPVTFGLLLNLLLSPFVRTLKRARIPEPIGAAFVVLSIVAALGIGGYFLAEPAQTWIAKAPQSLAVANIKLRKLRRPMEQVTKSADQITRAASATSGAPRTQEVTLAAEAARAI